MANERVRTGFDVPDKGTKLMVLTFFDRESDFFRLFDTGVDTSFCCPSPTGGRLVRVGVTHGGSHEESI